MVSFNNFMLLILLTVALISVTEAAQDGSALLSEEEKNELERQLEAINKPAIKSFKTKHGDIFDCIDIHKQLAFDHHLLRNHSVQLKPTTVPEWITGNNISERFGPFQLLQEGINCPDGTVIVKRTTMQNLMHARRLESRGFNSPSHFLTENNNTNINGPFYLARLNHGPNSISGVKGNLNLWEPQVSQHQFSVAFMAIGGGNKETFASIYVGWMVNPFLYQSDHVRLYTYWTTHGSPTGCYDMTCPGFVQVSKKIPLGIVLQPVSVYNGNQYELRLSLHQSFGNIYSIIGKHDRTTGDWWFSSGYENVGYWPGTLFSAPNLANNANYASWGGQVYSPETEKTPVMGSGHWPEKGFSKAAYVNSIKIVDVSGSVLDPKVKSMEVRESSPKCYRAIYVHENKEPWLRALYYGGPAGCIEK